MNGFNVSFALDAIHHFVSDPHRSQDDLIDKPDIKSLFRDFAACIPHLLADVGIMVKKQHFLRNGVIIFDRDKKTILPFQYGFPASRGIRCNDRFPAGQGFQYGFRGTFPVGGQDKYAALRQIWSDIRLFPEIFNTAVVDIRLQITGLQRGRI